MVHACGLIKIQVLMGVAAMLVRDAAEQDSILKYIFDHIERRCLYGAYGVRVKSHNVLFLALFKILGRAVASQEPAGEGPGKVVDCLALMAVKGAVAAGGKVAGDPEAFHK